MLSASMPYGHSLPLQLSKTRKGFTLLEILLVLGLAALIVLAAFFAYPKVRDSQRSNTEQGNVMTTATCIKNTFMGRYAGLTNATANQARCFPSNMNAGNNASTQAITSSWNDSVTVASTGTNASFTITYASVPTAVCLSLVPNLLQNFDGVTVGSNAPRDNKTDTATIIADCNAADPQDIVLSAR